LQEETIYNTHGTVKNRWMEIVWNYKLKTVKNMGRSYKYRKEILRLVQAPKYVISEDNGIINKRFC